MSQIQAVVLVGEPEDVAKALRDFVGQQAAVTVITPPAVPAARTVNGDEAGNPRVDFVKLVLTRADLAPRHMQLLRTLYHAGEAGMMRPDLVKVLGITTNEGIKGVIGPLGRRVARTPGHDEMAAADGQHSASGLLLEFRHMDNDTNYRLRPETRQALEELHLV